ncbi:hypothetical protein [Caballeronia sp. INML2]|nr:hypothetical protein [Caballeronia sp. INML2]
MPAMTVRRTHQGEVIASHAEYAPQPGKKPHIKREETTKEEPSPDGEKK